MNDDGQPGDARGLLLRAPAKVNLTLAVLGRRPDGYHELESLMVPIALADHLRLEPLPAGVELVVAPMAPGEPPAAASGSPGLAGQAVGTGPLPGAQHIPADARNLAWRAATAVGERAGWPGGVRIVLEKHIPAGAGLAGGSADAAAVLRGLAQLWGLAWPPEEWLELARRLGADVPFCLTSRPAVARGIGEQLRPVACGQPLWLCLLHPGTPLATPQVFAVWDQLPPAVQTRRPPLAEALAGLAAGDPLRVAPAVVNGLEPAAEQLCPAIPRLRAYLRRAGALAAALSGSGPTVFGLFSGPAAARAAAEAAVATGEAVWAWWGPGGIVQPA